MAVMVDPSAREVLRELHADLNLKWPMHKTTVERIWRSFDRSQRLKCLRAGAADGVVLQHPGDESLGNVVMIVPEWNIRDICDPGSDYLLDLLDFRARTTLFDQYRAGLGGNLGDKHFIQKMMTTKGLRHEDVDTFQDCYTFFLNGDDSKYGYCIRLLSEKEEESLVVFAPAIRAGLLIPQSMGQLVLDRQISLHQILTVLIDDILDIGSETRTRKSRTKKPDDTATAALGKLSLHANSSASALPDMVASARDQKDSLEGYLSLFPTEPTVLAHAVNICFFTRPELVADEKGRQLSVHTDRYISGAFFDAVRDALKGARFSRAVQHVQLRA